MTGFFRTQRDIESEIEDSFTIILQYGGSQKDLLVTVKTSVTTPMAKQLKQLVRGTKGSFIKVSKARSKTLINVRGHPKAEMFSCQFQQRSTCPQEEQIDAGKKPLDEGFGVEPEKMRGILTTYEEFDSSVQTYDPETKKYTGPYPSITGRWMGLYENVADAINGKEELAVKPTQSRDGLRVIELARESHEKGVTVQWK